MLPSMTAIRPTLRTLLPLLLLVLSLAGCDSNGGPVEHFGDDPLASSARSTPAVSPAADQDDDTDSEDDFKVANGTLAFHIEISGQVEQRSSDPKSRAHHKRVVNRTAELKSYMHGHASNGDLALNNSDAGHKPAPPPAGMDDLSHAIEACGDDEACQQAAALKMAMSAQGKAAIEDAGNQMYASLGRTHVWMQSRPCTAHLRIDDSQDDTRWVSDYGEGYDDSRWVTTHAVQKADQPFDCGADEYPDKKVTSVLYLDTKTGEYDLAIAPITAEVTDEVNGKAAKPRTLGTPRLMLTGMRGAKSGQPLQGNRTMQVTGAEGMPLDVKVNWTFTPD